MGGDSLKPGPTPYEQFLPLPTPCFKMFSERSPNDSLNISRKNQRQKYSE